LKFALTELAASAPQRMNGSQGEDCKDKFKNFPPRTTHAHPETQFTVSPAKTCD
jgi:hypothetical protein